MFVSYMVNMCQSNTELVPSSLMDRNVQLDKLCLHYHYQDSSNQLNKVYKTRHL
jgi:hypothetical protein